MARLEESPAVDTCEPRIGPCHGATGHSLIGAVVVVSDWLSLDGPGQELDLPLTLGRVYLPVRALLYQAKGVLPRFHGRLS
jgi:hypothetical protein